MKKLFLFSILCFFTQISFGQSSVEDQRRAAAMNDPKFIEFKKNHDARQAKEGSSLLTSSYYGYDEKLKTYFIDNIIPSQTPRSDSFTSKSEYVKVLNDWISKNKHLLKPEHKNSLITE